MTERTLEHVTIAQAQAGLSRVRARVNEAAARSGRDHAAVHVLAAVKYVDAASCVALLDAGVDGVAENRFRALVDKQNTIAGGNAGSTASTAWHFIGRLQSREAPAIAERVGMIHTLASMSAARRLGMLTRDSEHRLPELLVQVNVDGDEGKDGVPAPEVERFLGELPENVRVSGFMTMPAFASDPQQSRATFAALRELRDTLAPRCAGRHDLEHLSMGTSQDFAVAVEEGATHVRLGRILFGHAE